MSDIKKYENEFLEYTEKSTIARYKEKYSKLEYEIIEDRYFLQDGRSIIFDFVARKGNKTIVLEFVSKRDNSKKIEQINLLKRQAKEIFKNNFEFDVIVVNPKKEKQINIKNFDLFLLSIINYTYKENIRQKDPLFIEANTISNLIINVIDIREKKIIINGEGYLSYKVINNEDSDKYETTSDLYYFSFELLTTKLINLLFVEPYNIRQVIENKRNLTSYLESNNIEITFKFDI